MIQYRIEWRCWWLGRVFLLEKRREYSDGDLGKDYSKVMHACMRLCHFFLYYCDLTLVETEDIEAENMIESGAFFGVRCQVSSAHNL